MEKAELSKEQKARLDRVKVEAEIAAILGSIEGEASSDAAGEKFYRLVTAGRDGPSRDQDRYTFYVLVLHAAEEKKDAVVFERAYRELHAAFKGYPGAAAFLKVVELRLAELKKK